MEYEIRLETPPTLNVPRDRRQRRFSAGALPTEGHLRPNRYSVASPLPAPQRPKARPNRWARKTKNIAFSWARRAVAMKYLHFIVSQYYDRMAKWLTTPVAFLVAGIGTGIVGVAAGDPTTTVSQVFMWLLAGVSFLTAGITAVNWELDPGTLAERHLHKSVCWSSIADDLTVELSLETDQRHDAKWFMQNVEKNMTMTENLPPVLPEWVFAEQASDLMGGEMARALMELDRQFGKRKVHEIITNCVAVELDQEVAPAPEPELAPPDTPDDGFFNAENFENGDYLALPDLKQRLSTLHRRFRDEVRFERKEYNLVSLFGAQRKRTTMDVPIS